MMPRGNELLMPGQPLFIWVSLLLAFGLNHACPGALAQCARCAGSGRGVLERASAASRGVGAAFLFGLIMDASGVLYQGSMLAHTLLSFFAITIHRRLLWSNGLTAAQPAPCLPLFTLPCGAMVAGRIRRLFRLLIGAGAPGGLALWRPRRPGAGARARPPDRDKNQIRCDRRHARMTELKKGTRTSMGFQFPVLWAAAGFVLFCLACWCSASWFCRWCATTSWPPRLKTTASLWCPSCPTAGSSWTVNGVVLANNYSAYTRDHAIEGRRCGGHHRCAVAHR